MLADAGMPFRIIDIAQSADFPDAVSLADIRDLPSLTRALAGCERIVHLAAVHRDDVRPMSLYADVNVQGTRNVVDAARANGINQIIFTSSVACYGFAPPGTDERGAFAPFNEYGRTKAAGESVLRDW